MAKIRMAEIVIGSLSVIFVTNLAAPSSRAQSLPPRFEVDLSYPKPLPNKWVTGGIGGHCIDADDHVLLLNRQDVLEGDLNAGRLAPFMIELDTSGKVVHSWAIRTRSKERLRDFASARFRTASTLVTSTKTIMSGSQARPPE